MSDAGNKYSNRTATATVKTGSGKIRGFYVNSTSTGTIRFYDGTDTNGAVITNVITPAIGWHDLGEIAFATGLHVVIANTLNVTIVYK